MKNKKFLIICIIAIVLIAIDGVIFLLLNIEQVKRETLLEDEKVLETITIDNTKDDNEENAEKDIIGYLTIKSIGLEKAPIKEGTEDSILNNAIGHFSETSYLEGNVCLAGHNRGYKHNYFENLKNIKEKDLITYITKNEEKNYEVIRIEKINEEDISVLNNTKENQITLITCVENEPENRFCIIGKEIEKI